MRPQRYDRSDRRLCARSPAVRTVFFAESEPFIVFACDVIRSQIRLQAQEGIVHYDTCDKRLFFPERTSNPHYSVYWNVACHLDLTKDDFYWNRAERTLMISEIETIRHILREMDARLGVDGIRSVTYEEKPLDKLGDRFKRRAECRPLCRQEVYGELLDAVSAYEKGNGKAKTSTYVGSDFAYFIKD